MPILNQTSSQALFLRRGAPILLHREGHSVPCPCRTPEGFRSPRWHREHPTFPICNDRGFLAEPIELQIVGFIQPVFGMRRIGSQVLEEAFGQLQIDDHIGVFPITWKNLAVNFENWSQAGDEWVQFNDMRFMVVGWTKLPDPKDQSRYDHWECALRRISTLDIETI